MLASYEIWLDNKTLWQELDGSHILGVGHAVVNPYAKLFLGGSREAVHKTGTFKSTFSP